MRMIIVSEVKSLAAKLTHPYSISQYNHLSFYVDNKSKMAGICGVCEQNESKYKCPTCEMR
jgi:hypothetical protein